MPLLMMMQYFLGQKCCSCYIWYYTVVYGLRYARLANVPSRLTDESDVPVIKSSRLARWIHINVHLGEKTMPIDFFAACILYTWCGWAHEAIWTPWFCIILYKGTILDRLCQYFLSQSVKSEFSQENVVFVKACLFLFWTFD